MKLIDNGSSLKTSLNEKMTIEITKAEFLILFASIGEIQFNESYSNVINGALEGRCMPDASQIFEATSTTCLDVYNGLVEIYKGSNLSRRVNL